MCYGRGIWRDRIFHFFFFRILNHHLCRFEIFIPMLRIIQKLLKLICHFKLHMDIHVMIFSFVVIHLFMYLLIYTFIYSFNVKIRDVLKNRFINGIGFKVQILILWNWVCLCQGIGPVSQCSKIPDVVVNRRMSGKPFTR